MRPPTSGSSPPGGLAAGGRRSPTRSRRGSRARRLTRRALKDRSTCRSRPRRTRPGRARWLSSSPARDVARAAAQHGRRVALVDLWIEDPKLHEIVGLTPAEGIVDAFEYGVSLTKAAHQVDGVFFIAAGAYTAHAGDLFGHERWRKLHGGFRVEGALLLLYLSAGALARLSAVPDGLIVLSPDGFEPESSIGQGITAALERGTPLLGVVRERWTPVSAAPPSGTRPTRPGWRGGGDGRPALPY